VFNSLSVELWGFREKIAPGAFAGSLSNDIKALWNHDSNFVMGRTTNNTLRVAEDDHGLRVEIFPPDTQLMRDFTASIARGDVDQMSFGFSVLPDGDEWHENEDGEVIRTLTNVRLHEVSPVAFPAYQATEVGVRDIYGDKVEIPEGLRRAPGQLGDDDTGDGQIRAKAAGRNREIELIELEVLE
jgi:HK97 family phage prohead protease